MGMSASALLRGVGGAPRPYRRRRRRTDVLLDAVADLCNVGSGDEGKG